LRHGVYSVPAQETSGVTERGQTEAVAPGRSRQKEPT